MRRRPWSSMPRSRRDHESFFTPIVFSCSMDKLRCSSSFRVPDFLSRLRDLQEYSKFAAFTASLLNRSSKLSDLMSQIEAEMSKKKVQNLQKGSVPRSQGPIETLPYNKYV